MHAPEIRDNFFLVTAIRYAKNLFKLVSIGFEKKSPKYAKSEKQTFENSIYVEIFFNTCFKDLLFKSDSYQIEDFFLRIFW